MKPRFFYTIVTLLFLLIPLSGLVFYETGLTEQFEIELSRLLKMDIHDLKKRNCSRTNKYH